MPNIQPLIDAIEVVERRLDEYSLQCREWAIAELAGNDMATNYIGLIRHYFRANVGFY